MTGEKSSEVCTVPHRLVRVCDVCGCMRATVHVEDRGQFYGVSSVVLPLSAFQRFNSGPQVCEVGTFTLCGIHLLVLFLIS